MNTNGSLLFKEEVFQIVGCAFEVLNTLGHGLNEKFEFGLKGIPYRQQPRFPVACKGHHAGEFVPDLIGLGAVIVDAKVIDRITDHERGQMLNYLRICGLRVGVLLNFKHAKLDWERIVL